MVIVCNYDPTEEFISQFRSIRRKINLAEGKPRVMENLVATRSVIVSLFYQYVNAMLGREYRDRQIEYIGPDITWKLLERLAAKHRPTFVDLLSELEITEEKSKIGGENFFTVALKNSTGWTKAF